MSAALRLTIAMPAGLLVDSDDVVAFRAEDATGSFGILPGHADFLTVLAPCVLRWRTRGGEQRFCAVGGGMLRVVDGARISVACRDGALGDALDTLEARARAGRADAPECAGDPPGAAIPAAGRGGRRRPRGRRRRCGQWRGRP